MAQVTSQRLSCLMGSQIAAVEIKLESYWPADSLSLSYSGGVGMWSTRKKFPFVLQMLIKRGKKILTNLNTSI